LVVCAKKRLQGILNVGSFSVKKLRKLNIVIKTKIPFEFLIAVNFSYSSSVVHASGNNISAPASIHHEERKYVIPYSVSVMTKSKLLIFKPAPQNKRNFSKIKKMNDHTDVGLRAGQGRLEAFHSQRVGAGHDNKVGVDVAVFVTRADRRPKKIVRQKLLTRLSAIPYAIDHLRLCHKFLSRPMAAPFRGLLKIFDLI